MMNIKLIVQTNETNSLVLLTAETAAAGDTENRTYFLEPENAVAVANSILHAAELCGVEIHVQTDRGITDMQRLQLIARTQHIMRTYSGKKGNAAMQIVDSILAEVL